MGEAIGETARPVPGVVVLRPGTGLFFANAETVRDRIRADVARADGVRGR